MIIYVCDHCRKAHACPPDYDACELPEGWCKTGPDLDRDACSPNCDHAYLAAHPISEKKNED